MITKQQIPQTLQSLPGWLLWRYVQHAGESKPRKVPYYADGGPRSGKQGSPQDRQGLATLDDVLAALARNPDRYNGIGLALLPDFHVTALDFDHCVSDGRVLPEVARLVDGTYAELSPSGVGVRAFYQGDLPDGKSLATAEQFGFEVFNANGYVTFTGNVLPECELLGYDNTVAPLPDHVQAYHRQRMTERKPAATPSSDPLDTYEPQVGLSDEQIATLLAPLDPSMARQDWLQVGMAVHHETAGAGFHLWDAWSSGSDALYPGSDELQRTWDSFGHERGAKPVTARTLLKLAKERGVTLQHAETFDLPAEPDPDKPSRFQVVSAAEFSRGPHPGWIIKGVLPRAELVVLFGEPGAGKSFTATDMAAAIARGIDWRGLRTKAGRVVYVVAEGGGGFRSRLAAYAIHHQAQLDGVPLGVIHATPNLLNKSDAAGLVSAIQQYGGADLVVIDTFAQSIPGANENAAEDISRALAHCKAIHRATGATVVLVHHSGKDATKGARGWSGLKGAADAEIEVTRGPRGRALRVSKQKDGLDGLEFGFDLLTVPVGLDEDGDVISSCVVVEAELLPVGTGKRPMGKWETLVAEVVAEFALAQNAGIEVSAVLDEAVRRSPAAQDGKRDTRKQLAKRALLTLSEGDDAPYFIEDGTLSVLV